MDEMVAQKLSQYITTRILKQPGRSLPMDEKLITSGLIDSFSLVDLSLYIEDTFGVHLDDTELNADTFNSLAELSGLIQSRLD